jgi:hypothetical protein
VVAASAAAFRRQSRHRQSLPSAGIASRAVSSAHQHGPARLQVNSVPQPEQTRRREGLSKRGGLSNRFVMNRSQSRRCFHIRFMPDGGIIGDQHTRRIDQV